MREGAPHPHDLRKRELLAGIDRRVAAVKTVKHAMESIERSDPIGHVEGILESAVRSAHELFPQKTTHAATEFRGVVTKAYLMRAKIDFEDVDPYTLQEFEEHVDRLGKPDVILLHSLAMAADIQALKYAKVATAATDDTRLRSMVEEIRAREKKQKPIDWSKVKEIVVEPFSVSVIIEQESFRTMYKPNWLGVHLHNSPVNIIQDAGNRQNKETIVHENIHNVFDGLEMNIGGAKRALSVVGDFKEDSPDLDSSKYANRLRSVRKALRVPEVVNGSHEEFLAHLQNMPIEHSAFRDLLVPDEYALAQESDLRVRDLNPYLSTAGYEMNTLIGELREIISEKPESWLGKTSQKFLSEVYSKWLHVVRSMYAGRRHVQIDPSMKEDILLFFVVTNPMNFHHIDSYVAYKKGTQLEGNSANKIEQFPEQADNFLHASVI